MSDSEIVELFFARKEEAITATTSKYGGMIKTIAYRILNNWEDAEECENDVYLEAWNTIPPLDPRDYYPSYLGRVVRHIALDRCRLKNRKKRIPSYCELTEELEECIPSCETVENVVDRRILQDLIRAFLTNCKQEDRVIFVKRYWLFESITEISKEHGFSESKVKVTLLRIRKRLKKYLAESGYEG